MAATTTTLDRIHTGDMELAYRELGSGPAVLLLHGWPTSSFLWRGVMPAIARENRVIALDLPGFGGSDKPLEVRYDFALFTRAIDGFLEKLGVDKVAIAGHDLGGPIAARWALDNPHRVTRVALLNTLVYPEFSEAVVEFVRALMTPGPREELTSASGLESVIRLGLHDDSKLTREIVAGVTGPFGDDDSRRALANAAIGLEPGGFTDIATRMPSLNVPLRIVYGAEDRVLPDIAQTVERLKSDVPQAQVTALAGVGHFLQEESPDEVGELLAAFFTADPDS